MVLMCLNILRHRAQAACKNVVLMGREGLQRHLLHRERQEYRLDGDVNIAGSRVSMLDLTKDEAMPLQIVDLFCNY